MWSTRSRASARPSRSGSARLGWPTLTPFRDVQAVVVASATETHHRIGLEVLERGLPLLMEKPLADRLIVMSRSW